MVRRHLNQPGFLRLATLTYMTSDRFYFRQLLSGRDFATDDPMASQMANFVYLIGDRETRDAIVVDPAYGVTDILGILDRDGMNLCGVLASHYHPDHVGGSMMGHTIEGVRELLDIKGTKIHVQAEEADMVKKVTEVSDGDLEIHQPGDHILVGDIRIDLLHTPGHTPGSQCFLVEGTLVAGDTLFLEGCGRTDLPGSDAAAMYHSLHHTLAKIPDDTVLFPGHRYSFHSSATMGMTREMNYVFKPESEEQWMMMFSQ